MVRYGPLEHARAVRQIAERVQHFHSEKQHFRLYHGHTNSTRTVPRSAENVVDTSALDHVLRFDLAAKTVQVEPNVSMEQLVEATLQHGLMPLVVPEFRGITVGGAFAGTAGESSTYKHGIFDSTVQSIEIVLADGAVTHASTLENTDLLRGSGGACGTLGVVTLLEVQLTDAHDHVLVQYHPVRSSAEAVSLIQQLDTDPGVSFIDGILFSPNAGVVMSGALAPYPLPTNTPLCRFSRPWDQHFYRHVEKRLLPARLPWADVIPIRDYFFRYDRGCFWGAQRAFAYFRVPFNRVTRWALDPFMASRVMFHAMHESGLADRAVVQDVAVPIAATAGFVAWQDAELGCYPLWLCPLRAVGEGADAASEKGGPATERRSFGAGRKAGLRDMFCNIGIWIMAPSKSHDEFVGLNRRIEKEVARLGGLKTLYAHSYYTEEEFWSIYDREAYQALRSKYNAESLIDVFEKVTVRARRKESSAVTHGTVAARVVRMVKDALKERWPFRGLYGVWKVLTSKEYLLKHD